MDIIKRLFGTGSSRPDLATPSQIDGRPETTALEVDSQATKRRELVRVLTRDTLRATGIPESWVESQILLELSRGGQPLIHLRLVVKHWDERLLKYTVAFQQLLLREIAGFEPNVREWLLSITWQYQVGDQCPHLEMPDPESWTLAMPRAPQTAPPDPEPALTATAPKPGPRDELQDDLAQLYAVRDANLTGPDSLRGASDGKKAAAPIIPDVII